MQPTSPTAYDEIPYPGGAYQQSHPGRLETLAKLFGMTPADIRRCRVLELGCGDGSNLIPMACALPEGTFLGIDSSQRQLEPGRGMITALGLRNIELRHCDIRGVDSGFGEFDYIIAHGVYSWVPMEVQQKVLDICNERLASQGVAYVSYNTHPGWRMRGMLRDMMLYHVRTLDDPRQQIEQARALIDWLGETVQAENNPYGMLLKRELQQMREWPDSYLRHDSLGDINEPVYFHEFIEHAERQGLQYLAEAEFPSMISSNYAAPVDEALNRLGRNIIEMEQYMDFVRNRLFRQTLLCHREIKLNRSLGPWSLAGFHVAARLRATHPALNLDSTDSEAFRSGSQLTVSTSQPVVKAALLCLGESWPAAIPFSELVAKARSLIHSGGGNAKQASIEADAETLGSVLLTCFTKGLCELLAHPPEFVLAPGERPLACPFARQQVRDRDAVFNRRHELVPLDPLSRRLLPLLDGEHDRRSLIAILTDRVLDGTLVLTQDDRPVRDREEIGSLMESELEMKLARLGRSALIVG